MLAAYVSDFVARNAAARTLKKGLDEVGVGFSPSADHLTFRTDDIDRRAEEFLRLGYAFSETIQYKDWFAKVYRKPGYPALFIDQAYADERGRTSIIPGWVKRFGDRTLHHIAVRVEDIERAMDRLQQAGIRFAGPIVGARGGPLRQVFTVPEDAEGAAFSVVELTERHEGYQGFSPPQADSLMRSTVRKRGT
ncbi:MAG: VOC family protein [Nitrospirae bacterium]|nr:VOC family protein [Nitrospirota bacterium]